jgi:multiple sugar transport system substrate-binding protein
VRAVTLLLVCAASLFAAGCGATADGPNPPFEPSAVPASMVAPRAIRPGSVSGTIELMSWQSTPVEAKLIAQKIREFEHRYPRIKVQVYSYTGDYPSGVMTRFAGNDAPDVLAVNAAYAPDWIARGMLLPLDGYVQGSKFDADKFHPRLVKGLRGTDEHLYGLPKDYSTVALFSNRTLLDAANVTTPTDWNELRDTARRLTKGNRVGLCLPASWERLMLFAMQAGGGIVSEDGTHMIASSPKTTEAVEFYVGLLRDGYAATPASLGASWCGDAFGKGMAAMAFEGTWLMPPLKSSYPNIKYQISEVPKGEHQATLAFAPAWSIARDSKNPDAAWLLLSYLTGRDGMQKWIDEGLALPSRTDVTAPPGREALEAGLEYATVWQLPPGFMNKVFMTAENELTAVVEGERTVDQMLARIDEVGKPMLAQQAAKR